MSRSPAAIAAIALSIMVATVAWSQTPQVPASQAQIQLSFAPVVKRATPAVVNIYAKKVVATRVSPFANDPFFGNLFRGQGQVVPRVQNSLGSGVIVSPDGIVVSNYHVAGDADAIRVVLHDRREFDARVLMADEQADLAVLKLEGAQDLPALPLRDSDEVEVGDLVLAIGNPFGIGQTVTSGIVSGLARSGVTAGDGRGYFIQTDAAINPGNSGGALVDMQGRLVGINTAILTRSGGSNGVGFAIPANLVKRFVAQAKAGRERFVRPWAGVSGQSVDAALAEGLGMGLPRGVVLSELHPQSPFAKAGLAAGDVVLTLGGMPVNSPQEMLFRMSAAVIGDKLSVRYLRDGRERTTRVALIAPPEIPPRAPVTVPGDRILRGLRAVNVNPAVATEYRLEGVTSGVMVVKTGPVAAQVGLRPGDVLRRINGIEIATTRDLLRATEFDTRSWALEFERGGKQRVLRFRV